MNIKKILLGILIGTSCFLTSPLITNTVAKAEEPLIKCSTSGSTEDCTVCDLVILFRDVFHLLLTVLASLAVLMMVIGGVYIMLGGANSSYYTSGVDTIKNAVIGILLILGSFVFLNTILVVLGFQKANFESIIKLQGIGFDITCSSTSYFNDRGMGGSGAASNGGVIGGTGPLTCSSVKLEEVVPMDSSVKADLSFASEKSGAPIPLLASVMYVECTAAFSHSNAPAPICNDRPGVATGPMQLSKDLFSIYNCDPNTNMYDRRQSLVCAGKMLKYWLDKGPGGCSTITKACTDLAISKYCGKCYQKNRCAAKNDTSYCDGVWKYYQEFSKCAAPVNTGGGASSTKMNKITLHFSSGKYQEYHDDYHINIGYDSNTKKAIYKQVTSFSTPCNPAPGSSETACHTRGDNKGNVGISMLCGAKSDNDTDDICTDVQIEMMAQVTAEVMASQNIPLSEVRDHEQRAAVATDPYDCATHPHYPATPDGRGGCRSDIREFRTKVMSKIPVYVDKIKKGAIKPRAFN